MVDATGQFELVAAGEDGIETLLVADREQPVDAIVRDLVVQLDAR